MAADGKDYETKITADPTKFEAGMKKASQAAVDASNTIDGQFKRIGDSVSTVTKYLAGFTAVLAGGGALKKFISDANEWNGQAASMSKQLGISTEKASVLNVALNHLGLSSDVYTDAAMKMSKQVQGNAQAFEVLGVKTRDVSGAYRPVTELMGEVNAKLAAIKNPIEQNIAGQQIYGKGWTEVRGILKLTAQGMADAEVRARQLGLIVGPEGVAMSKQYGEQMRDLNLVGKSLEVQFGNQLLPVFTRLGKFMGEEAPAMGKVFGTVLEAVGFVAAAVWLTLKDMGDSMGALAAQAGALLHGDLDGFRAIGKARDEEAAKNEAAFERMKANYGKPMEVAAPTYTTGQNEPGKQYRFKEKVEKDGGPDKSRMAQWEAELSDRKAALERQGMVEGQYREMGKAAELKYWTDLKGTKNLSDTEIIALTRKSADTEMSMIKRAFEVKVATLQAEAAAFKNNIQERLRLELQIQSKYQAGTKEYEVAAKHIVEIQRHATEQERTMREARVQAERDARLEGIALEEQTLHAAVRSGLVTQLQLLSALEGFEQRRTDIARDALQQRLGAALLDPDRNPVEVQKINLELEALAQQHELRLGQIRGQTLQIQRQATAQEHAMRSDRLQAERDARLQGIALEEQTLHTSVQLGLVTHQQLLSAQAAFEQRRTDIAREALQQRLEATLLDRDRNPVEVQKINLELEALAQQHELRLGQIRGAALVESQRDVTGTMGSIQLSWAGLRTRLGQGTLTLGGLIKGAFQSVYAAVLDTLAKLAAKWLTDLILKKVMSKTAAAGQIADNAAVAGAAATASAAAIPFVGWAMAPEAGAAVFGTAMGYMGALASASGGYDIPGNINPIEQTHAREMILPAKHADVIRGLADNGGAGGRSDGGMITIHGSPDDSIKLKDLGRVLQKMNRNFEFVR